MKILDKYIAKNFLIGYAIAFCVLIGLRVIIDLFVNLDEFTEHADMGVVGVLSNILSFYGLNITMYYREFAGMIAIVAAAFSLGKMVRSHELVAVMASGVSLKRVIAPIFYLSLALTGLLIADQELIIPAISEKLTRKQDAVPGEEAYDVWFISDENGSLISTPIFKTSTDTMLSPTIVTRERIAGSNIWKATGIIYAKTAAYNHYTHGWDLMDGSLMVQGSTEGPARIESYQSDITPKDMPIRRRSQHTSLLSSRQLSELAANKTKIRDLAQLYSQKHFRITEPLINLVMLMVSLPILVCRDPKTMKSATMISFGLTTACFITTFVCKMLATEVVFERVIPELWAWLPLFIFLPVAFVELDSMKT